jgi:signal-transduction protein with cAMP-binding, CBS, and nucleotidyltransferase domain
MARLIDLPKIRRALSELDRIAAEHPEYCQRQGQWTENAVREIVMRTPDRLRTAKYRDRLRANGNWRLTAHLSAEAKAALDRLRQAHPDLTINELLSGLLTGQISHD